MKCKKCPWYEEGINYNHCKRFRFEYYKVFENCILVNDDGSDNEEELEKAGEWLP
jgi:hypothetical protein